MILGCLFGLLWWFRVVGFGVIGSLFLSVGTGSPLSWRNSSFLSVIYVFSPSRIFSTRNLKWDLAFTYAHDSTNPSEKISPSIKKQEAQLSEHSSLTKQPPYLSLQANPSDPQPPLPTKTLPSHMTLSFTLY